MSQKSRLIEIDICSGEDNEVVITNAPMDVLQEASEVVSQYAESESPCGIAEEDFVHFVKSNGYDIEECDDASVVYTPEVYEASNSNY